tara:strand:+ start:32 stop:625 length:594 start_codon:yes stop_codon:yes gene_type:complete
MRLKKTCSVCKEEIESWDDNWVWKNEKSMHSDCAEGKKESNDPNLIFEMNGGIGDILKVYKDKITITPKGTIGFLTKGLQGTKTIPYTSITSVQVRKAGSAISGYIQFGVLGGNESRKGAFDAMTDENTFAFMKTERNSLAIEIGKYVESQMIKLNRPQTQSAPISIADEIRKFAELKKDGLITEEEFDKKKKELLK